MWKKWFAPIADEIDDNVDDLLFPFSILQNAHHFLPLTPFSVAYLFYFRLSTWFNPIWKVAQRLRNNNDNKTKKKKKKPSENVAKLQKRRRKNKSPEFWSDALMLMRDCGNVKTVKCCQIEVKKKTKKNLTERTTTRKRRAASMLKWRCSHPHERKRNERKIQFEFFM